MKELEHVCSSFSVMFETDDARNELVCPICKKNDNVNDRLSTLKLNILNTCVDALNKTGENKKRLQDLLSHIDNVINLTKQYKTEGLISSSLEKFIEVRNEVKEKMEDHINSAPLCDICKETIDCRGNKANLVSYAGSSKSVESMGPLNKSTKDLACSNSIYNLTDVTRTKLGYFEKKFKEIVKVKRLQNEDGSTNEEKQVITIRTEMRNPHEIKGTVSRINENEQYVDSSVLEGMGHEEDTLNLNSNRLDSSETNPEHATENHQTSEPKSQAFTSGGQPKEIINKGKQANVGGSICDIKTSSVILSPNLNVLKNSCNATTKNFKKPSVDSLMCCPKKTTSGHELAQSNTITQGDIPLCKRVLTPTSDNMLSIDRPLKDKHKCRLPCHLNEATASNGNITKNKSILTDALWRDVWTSTTDLLPVPSKIVNVKPKLILRREAIGSGKEKSKQAKQSNSCCIVKIIPKSAKLSYLQEREKPNQDPQKVVLKILDIIKKTYMPSNSAIEDSCVMEISKENRMQNICDRCKSKLNDAYLLKYVLLNEGSAKECGVNSTKGQNAENISRDTSYSSMSCKSIGVGSMKSGLGENHVCSNLSAPSIPSQKRMFCLAKNNSEISYYKTCCKMVQTTPKPVCCSTKRSSSSGCSCKKSAASVKYIYTYLKTRDVGTSTRRSTRFDVRTITRRKNHTRRKINFEDCTCYSDSYFHEDKEQKEITSSRSYNDGYFYKW